MTSPRMAVLPTLLLLAAGCSMNYTDSMRPVRDQLASNSPDRALAAFEDRYPGSDDGDRLLFLMEKGNLLRLSGRPAEAIPLLLEADRLSDMLRGVDPSEEVASLLTSDLARAYRGADYESVFINYCLAACYTMIGQPSEALVECRRVSFKLGVYNDRYGGTSRYSDDAFVQYMIGALYESVGDLDDALIAYRRSIEIYESDYAGLYGMEVPERVRADILRVSGSLPGLSDLHESFLRRWPGTAWRSGADSLDGEVLVVLEESVIPARTSRVAQTWTENRLIRIAVPSIQLARSAGSPEFVIRSGGASERGFLAENLAAIAAGNLEDHAARDLARAVARAALKTAAAGAAEEIVEELTGEEDSFWSEGAGILVSLIGAATEQADLRAWLTLPARIHVARITLPQGERTVSAELGGRTVWTGPVEVEAGRISFVFARSTGWK